MNAGNVEAPSAMRRRNWRLAFFAIIIMTVCVGTIVAWTLTRRDGVAFACETFTGEQRFTVNADSSSANVSNAINAFELASKVFDIAVREADPYRAISMVSIDSNCTQNTDGTWSVNITYSFSAITVPGMIQFKTGGLVVKINPEEHVIQFLSWNR